MLDQNWLGREGIMMTREKSISLNIYFFLYFLLVSKDNKGFTASQLLWIFSGLKKQKVEDIKFHKHTLSKRKFWKARQIHQSRGQQVNSMATHLKHFEEEVVKGNEKGRLVQELCVCLIPGEETTQGRKQKGELSIHSFFHLFIYLFSYSKLYLEYATASKNMSVCISG